MFRLHEFHCIYIAQKSDEGWTYPERVVVVGEGEIVKYIYSSITSVDINDLCPVQYSFESRFILDE